MSSERVKPGAHPDAGDSGRRKRLTSRWPYSRSTVSLEQSLRLPGGIRRLESRILFVETLLISLAILAIASGDFLLGKNVTLGYLYLVPLSYSALTHRFRTTLILVVLCIVLRQVFGPLELASWGSIIRDWILTGIFVAVVAALSQLGLERRAFFETARRQRDELLGEMELAARVQQQLLQQTAVPAEHFDVVAHTISAKIVGGDYYDFIQLSEDRVGVVVADISGKGLPAALLMPAVRMVLRTAASSTSSISEVLRSLNDSLLESTEHASYATIVYGILNTRSGEFTYSNGGHQPVLFVKRSTHQVFWLETGGPPVGLLQGVSYQEASIDLEPGDLLVFFTDGIVEAADAEEEEYGLERLIEVVRKNEDLPAQALVDAIHGDVDRYASRDSALDDATVIALKVPEARPG